MNSLETNAGNALIALLSNDAEVAKVRPILWDTEEDATIPRISVKVNQGAEIIYRMGVYRSSVELKIVVEARQNIMDRITEGVRRLTTDDENAHVVLNQIQAKYFAFAIEAGNTSGVTVTGKKRARTITLNLVGFDLDRFG